MKRSRMTKVYRVLLDDVALSSNDRRAWLGPSETRRAREFHDTHLERRYVSAHVALRFVLGRALDRQPADISFLTNAWGRPELTGGPFFNLSHSGSLALIAVDSEAAIGVDIEEAGRTIDPSLLDDILSTEEKRSFANRHSVQQLLLRLWTRKEAVLKAFGRGLSYHPRQVTVGLEPASFHVWRHVELQIGEGVANFCYLDLDTGKNEVAALAKLGSAVRSTITVEQLIL